MMPISEVEVAPSTSTIEDITRIVLEKNIGSVVLTIKNAISGMVTKTDLLKAYQNSLDKSTLVERIMTTKLIYINQNETRDRAADVMNENKIHHILVVDDDANVLGLVTSFDIVSEFSVDPSESLSSIRKLFDISKQKKENFKKLIRDKYDAIKYYFKKPEEKEKHDVCEHNVEKETCKQSHEIQNLDQLGSETKTCELESENPKFCENQQRNTECENQQNVPEPCENQQRNTECENQQMDQKLNESEQKDKKLNEIEQENPKFCENQQRNTECENQQRDPEWSENQKKGSKME